MNAQVKTQTIVTLTRCALTSKDPTSVTVSEATRAMGKVVQVFLFYMTGVNGPVLFLSKFLSFSNIIMNELTAL